MTQLWNVSCGLSNTDVIIKIWLKSDKSLNQNLFPSFVWFTNTDGHQSHTFTCRYLSPCSSIVGLIPASLPSYISVSLFFLFCCITAIQQVYFPLVKTFTPPRHDFVLQKWQKKKNPVDNCATIHFWWPIKMTDAIILQDPRIYSFRIPLMR